MIRLIRSAYASGPNPLKAIQWSKEVTDFINRKHPGGNVQVFTGQFGAYGAIYWSAEFEDFPAMDRWMQEIMADQDYWEMMNKAEGLFLAGRGRDVVMRSA